MSDGTGVEKHVFKAALNYLSRRDHTRAELSAKLRKKGFEASAVNDALERCTAFSYLDDEKTAGGIYRHFASSGYGVHRIRMEMKKKGVDARLIERVIQEKHDEESELARARRMFRKKQAGLAREKDKRKKREKTWRYLYNRGFSGDIIARLIGRDADME